MSTLYELTGELLELMDMMEDPDCDPQMIQDTMEGSKLEFTEKVEGYLMVMLDLEGNAEKLKKEEDRLSRRRKTIENNIKNLKKNLMQSMEVLDKTKVKTEHFSVTLKNSAPSLVIDQEGDIPDKYKISQPDKIDRNKLKEFLKGLSENETCEYAHLESSKCLLIK